MAKNEQVNPEDESAPVAPEVDTAALEKAVAEAQQKLDTVQAGFNDAAGDLTKMLAFADQIKAAKREHEKAVANLAAATYSIRAAERLAFSVELKEQIAELVAPFEAKARELSLTGVHVTFSADGGIQVSVTDASRPVGKRDTTPRTRSVGGDGQDGKNRSLWTYNGNTYTSRELIQQFGDEAMGKEGWAENVLDRADNWKEPRWGPNGNEPMKSGPGFDAPLKALAAKLGATR